MIPHEAWHMAEMGLSVSIAAPVFIRLTRHRIDLGRLSWNGLVAGPFFVFLHASIVMTMATTEPPLLLHGALHALIFVGAVIFWLPVLGTRRRLGDGERCAYLLIAAPSLDLAGVGVIATGQNAAGLAMIVTMLPIGAIAVALAWRWITQEERNVQAAERLEAHVARAIPSR